MIWSQIIRFIKLLFYRFKKTRVKAVYDDDLLDLLESIKIKEQIEKGEYRCKFCNTVVTLENLQALIKNQGKFEVICSNPICISKL